MAITVSMIEEKEFKNKMLGYDPVEVDEFLDDICDEMVSMQAEIAALKNKLSLSQQQPAPVYAPVPAPLAPAPAPAPSANAQASEASAQKLLARAQKFYDDTVADAERQAAEIIEKAKASVPARDGEIAALDGEREALREEVDMLKAAAKDYRARFIRLVEDQKHVLNAETELFE